MDTTFKIILGEISENYFELHWTSENIGHAVFTIYTKERGQFLFLQGINLASKKGTIKVLLNYGNISNNYEMYLEKHNLKQKLQLIVQVPVQVPVQNNHYNLPTVQNNFLTTKNISFIVIFVMLFIIITWVCLITTPKTFLSNGLKMNLNIS